MNPEYEDRSFCPAQYHSCSVPKKHTEAYINYKLFGLLLRFIINQLLQHKFTHNPCPCLATCLVPFISTAFSSCFLCVWVETVSFISYSQSSLGLVDPPILLDNQCFIKPICEGQIFTVYKKHYPTTELNINENGNPQKQTGNKEINKSKGSQFLQKIILMDRFLGSQSGLLTYTNNTFSPEREGSEPNMHQRC